MPLTPPNPMTSLPSLSNMKSASHNFTLRNVRHLAVAMCLAVVLSAVNIAAAAAADAAAEPAPSSSASPEGKTAEVKKATPEKNVARTKQVDVDVDLDVEIAPAEPSQPTKPGQATINVKTLTPEQVKKLQAQTQGKFTLPGMKMRKVAYLGVATAPVSRELGVHLKLAEGFGLIVVHVEKDSPADKAGVKPDDVIHKLDGQLAINTEQLGTLVRSHKKGDKIKLTIFRKGESKTLDATLTEKMIAINPDPQTIHIRAIQLQPGQAGNIPNLRNLPNGKPGQFQIAPMLRMKWRDGTHELSISQKDGKKHLVAKDMEGTVLFEGPIDSEDDRKAVPADIKPKLEKLEKSTRLQVIPFQGRAPGAIPGLQQGNVDHRRIMQMVDQHLTKLNRASRINDANQADDASSASDADKQADRRVDDLRKRIHDDLEKQLKQLEVDVEQYKARIAAQPAGGIPAGNRLFASRTATASFSDNEHALILKVNADGKHLVAKDKQGTVLFEGPVNDEAQRKAIPAPILAKLKTLEDSTKISIRINDRRVAP